MARCRSLSRMVPAAARSCSLPPPLMDAPSASRPAAPYGGPYPGGWRPAWVLPPALAAVASLALSLVPTAAWTDLLAAWQPTTGGDVTRALYAELGSRLRLVGTVFAAFAVGAAVLRPSFGTAERSFADGARTLARDAV